MSRTVITERLCLHAIEDKDLEAMLALFTDAEVYKTFMLPDFKCYEEQVKLFERLKTLSNQAGRFVYGIYLHGELIGFLNDVEIAGEEIELGYVISPKHKNKGYATEVLTAMMELLFTEGFTMVKAGAFEKNTASMRVMEKSGMTRIAKQDEITYRGKIHRCIYYEKNLKNK